MILRHINRARTRRASRKSESVRVREAKKAMVLLRDLFIVAFYDLKSNIQVSVLAAEHLCCEC
jgi:hypothetical protein